MSAAPSAPTSSRRRPRAGRASAPRPAQSKGAAPAAPFFFGNAAQQPTGVSASGPQIGINSFRRMVDSSIDYGTCSLLHGNEITSAVGPMEPSPRVVPQRSRRPSDEEPLPVRKLDRRRCLGTCVRLRHLSTERCERRTGELHFQIVRTDQRSCPRTARVSERPSPSIWARWRWRYWHCDERRRQQLPSALARHTSPRPYEIDLTSVPRWVAATQSNARMSGSRHSLGIG